MDRKQKLRLIQLNLLVFGILIIIFTYSEKKTPDQSLISKETQEKIQKRAENKTNESDVFYNIEYSGLDLSGNRFVLKSKEASNSKQNQEMVNMKNVEAYFYFKDDTVLKILSDTGIYNNKTLDMNFKGNVTANYEKSVLFAEKAEYSNSQSFLSISDKVKINDIRGSMLADKLLFDIKKKTLNISSFEDGIIDTNVNLK